MENEITLTTAFNSNTNNIMDTCRKCGEEKFDCECDDDSGDFLLSAVVGAATDSAIIGGLVGGDIIGGMLGDGLDGDLMD